MILRGQLRGKVGRRREYFFEKPLRNQRLFAFPANVRPPSCAQDGAIIALLRRLDLVLHSTARAVFWLCGYLALEWLFHATKPSLVSSAPPSAQLLLLIATPAVFFAWILPAHLLLAGLDSMRPSAKVRWLAALVPALTATVLIVMLTENFARTVFDYGIADTRGVVTAVLLALIAGAALWMWQSEGLALARGTLRRRTAIAAVALVLTSVAGSAIAGLAVDRSAPARASSRPVRRPNVLLVGLDGVTARLTSPYGAPAGSTPHLEDLARRGIVFENAFSNAGRTYNSVASMLTGKSPVETPGLLLSYLEGPASVEHLPVLLHEAGYRGAQVGVGLQIDANDANMKGGFDVVNGRPGVPGSSKKDISRLRDRLDLYRGQLVKRVADRIPHILYIRMMHDEYRFLVGEADDDVARHFADARRLELAQSFIQQRQEPWFLHVHLLDAHACDACGRVVKNVDASLGQLLGMLRATEQLDRTLIIVYSDHSPAWGTTERLPLVIVPPGGGAARRIRNNVQLTDVAPTILGYLGLPKAEWMTGVSLFAGEPEPRRPIMSLAPFADPKFVGIVICDRWGALDLATHSFRSGTVANHTAPCASDPSFEQEGRALLLETLRRASSASEPAT